uniref:G_PROTEIN_RECEP_F1_2 domain-containing protein n=1 Tax=Panagrellus redivivus TaxID=6233 RepID=A0A7E4ZXI6_PANRE
MLILSFMLPLSSIVTSLYSLFGGDFYSPIGYHIRLYMGFGCQMIDMLTLVISINCVIASLRASQEPLLKRKWHGYIAVVVCAVVSCCVAGAFYFSGYTLCIPFSIFATTTHLVCFVTEVVILFISIRRRKIVPFDYKLTVRHKLVRNIKLLQILCPYLFLTTVLSACGPVIFLYANYNITTSRTVYVSLFYFFYNIALLSIIVIFIWKCHTQTTKTEVAVIKIVKNHTSDDHFLHLRNQWNS